MDIEKIVGGIILLIIGIIVVFNLVGATAVDLTDSATNISSSGLPLASLFSPTGIVLLIFMVGILLAILGAVMKFAKSHK